MKVLHNMDLSKKTSNSKSESNSATSNTIFRLMLALFLFAICITLYFINQFTQPTVVQSTFYPTVCPTAIESYDVPLDYDTFINRIENANQDFLISSIDNGIFKLQSDYASASLILIMQTGNITMANMHIELDFTPIDSSMSAVEQSIYKAIYIESTMDAYEMLCFAMHTLCNISVDACESIFSYAHFNDVISAKNHSIMFPNGSSIKINATASAVAIEFIDINKG